MPASSISSLSSWAVYLAATLALASVLAPADLAVATGSRESSAYATLRGVVGLLDEMRPGMSTVLSYGSAGSEFVIWTRGHQVGYDLGNLSVSLPCKWDVEAETLYPGVDYLVAAAAGSLEVSQVG